MNDVSFPTHYRIADGRIWDIAAALFVAEAPADAIVVDLYADGRPGDAAYLRRTLESRGKVVGPELMTLEEAKTKKMQQIDAETSSAILAGFDYAVDGTTYHFSYDSYDQQNFSDTANMCQFALSGMPDMPATVQWNSYTVPDGVLVRHTFDATNFLSLYTAGAMAHKAARMAEGGARKEEVEAAQSIADLEGI